MTIDKLIINSTNKNKLLALITAIELNFMGFSVSFLTLSSKCGFLNILTNNLVFAKIIISCFYQNSSDSLLVVCPVWEAVGNLV
jgi:hypothetical protein